MVITPGITPAISPGLQQPSGLTPICELQGDGFASPYLDQAVRARGLVYADLDQTSRKGFFIQVENCDANPATSDGIFVYLGQRGEWVQVGDWVELRGEVQEYYGRTEIAASPQDVTVLASDQPLPVATELVAPFDDGESRSYFEALEGMYARLSQALVVGPTGADGRTWLVSAGLGIERVFQDDPGGTGEVVCSGDGGLFEIAPQAVVGDRVQGLEGALDYTLGEYCLQLTAQPQVTPALRSAADKDQAASSQGNRGEFFPIQITTQAPAPPASLNLEGEFSLATFNLAGLFDTVDDPATEDEVLTASEYQRRLEKRALAVHALGEPALIAVQEAENLGTLQALAARPEIKAEYRILTQDGPDLRGLDVALLYQGDQVELLQEDVRQGCTALVDGLGPDGNQDVLNPLNDLTCDANGDGILDGNRLFSRPPLLARLRVCLEGCQPATGAGQAVELWLIANHWKSKVEDTHEIRYTLPRRLEEARFVAGLVKEIQIAFPSAHIIVTGDLNDEPGSPPLAELNGLANQLWRVPRSERYTYIYRGRSQALDHVLLSLAPGLFPDAVTPYHVNADYPAIFESVDGTFQRSSDHDPLLVHFKRLDQRYFLPVVSQ